MLAWLLSDDIDPFSRCIVLGMRSLSNCAGWHRDQEEQIRRWSRRAVHVLPRLLLCKDADAMIIMICRLNLVHIASRAASGHSRASCAAELATLVEVVTVSVARGCHKLTPLRKHF